MVFVSASAQTISFGIRVFGANLGRMDITHTHLDNGNEFYTIESNTKAKLLWITKTYHSLFHATYHNGQLISSSHIETENGKTVRWANVDYNGNEYHVDCNKGKRSFTEKPGSSDASIYFDDCSKVNRIFYLPDADFYEIKHTGNNSFEFKSGDGHRNVYLLKDGKITSMEFHLALVTVYMTKIN